MLTWLQFYFTITKYWKVNFRHTSFSWNDCTMMIGLFCFGHSSVHVPHSFTSSLLVSSVLVAHRNSSVLRRNVRFLLNWNEIVKHSVTHFAQKLRLVTPCFQLNCHICLKINGILELTDKTNWDRLIGLQKKCWLKKRLWQLKIIRTDFGNRHLERIKKNADRRSKNCN